MAGPVTRLGLEATAEELSHDVQRWEHGSFAYLRNLQTAARNRGRVELMRWKKKGDHFGRLVAVKRMPNAWVESGPQSFQERFPESSERPWCDIGMLQELNRLSFPAVCQLLGVFRDDQVTYVVTSLATEGELFTWCKSGPRPGRDREARMKPLVSQITSAVSLLHDHGVAHCDLSLENILLTRDDNDNLKVKLIDFGMSSAGRMRHDGRDVGKPSYQAPEIHKAKPYDAFLADAFALGVVFFAMAVREYPWNSTKEGKCERYEYAHRHGWAHFIKEHKLRDESGKKLCQVFSAELSELLGSLLLLEPEERVNLGEACYQVGCMGEEDSTAVGAGRSVWTLGWHENEATKATLTRGPARPFLLGGHSNRGRGARAARTGKGPAEEDLFPKAATKLTSQAAWVKRSPAVARGRDNRSHSGSSSSSGRASTTSSPRGSDSRVRSASASATSSASGDSSPSALAGDAATLAGASSTAMTAAPAVAKLAP